MTRRLKIRKGHIYWGCGGGQRIVTMETLTHIFYIMVKGRRCGVGSHCSRKAFRSWAYKEVDRCKT